MYRVIAAVALLAVSSPAWGSLARVPFLTEPEPIGRFTRQAALDLTGKELFSQCHGIHSMPTRGITGGDTIYIQVVTDPGWHRVLYGCVWEHSGEREPLWLTSYGSRGSGQGQLNHPLGIALDTTSYLGLGDCYHAYVADRENNRVVRLRMNLASRSLVQVDCITGLERPCDVSCVSNASGGVHLLVASSGGDRISLYEIGPSGDSMQLLGHFGQSGSGINQFDTPSGVSLAPTARPGVYDAYVADRGNRRLVYIEVDVAEVHFEWIRTQEDPKCEADFVSVDYNRLGDVYAVDRAQNRIWAFSRGLGALDYTHHDSLVEPRYISSYRDELALTERWTNVSGIQYFRIVPNINSITVDTLFDPTRDTTSIHFTLGELDAFVDIDILHGTQTVRHLVVDSAMQILDRQSHFWDGRDDSGQLVLPDVYTIRIKASFTAGETLPELWALHESNIRAKGTIAPSVISSNTTWDSEGDPYVASGHGLSINGGTSGITLTIEPGVRIMFTDDPQRHGIAVYGDDRVVAHGSPTDSVLFMPHHKMYEPFDPNQRGLWAGIVFKYGSAGGSFRHCVFENGGGGVEGAVVYVNAPTSPYIVDVDSSHFRGSAGKGISTDNDLSTERVDVDHTHFSYCADYPLFEVMAPNVADVCATCTFSDNDTNGIRVRAGPVAEDWIQSSCTWPCCGQGWFYDLNDELHIKSESYPVLTLDPGVTIRMPPGEFIQVGSVTDVNKKGALVARGIAGQMINFRGQDPRPDTGDWNGIHIRRDPSNYSAFSYCQFQGGTGRHGMSIGDLDFYPMLHCDQSSPSVHRCRFSGGSRSPTLEFGTGIGVEKGSPLIVGCKFQGNECGIAGDFTDVESFTTEQCHFAGNEYGFFSNDIEDEAEIQLRLSNLRGNTSAGVINYIDETDSLDARNNWWGPANNGAPGPPNDWYYGRVKTNPWSPDSNAIWTYDVGAVAIEVPTGWVLPGQLVPKARACNNMDTTVAFWARMTIGSVYSQTVVCTLPALSVDTVFFPAAELDSGFYDVGFEVLVDGDEQPANDTVSTTAWVRDSSDAASIEVTMPPESITVEDKLAPTVLVANNTDRTRYVPVEFSLDDELLDTDSVLAGARETTAVAFDSMFFPPGNHQVKFNTCLEIDDNRANDTILSDVEVLSGDFWVEEASPPLSGAKMCWDEAGHVYAVNRNQVEVHRYDTKDRTWSSVADPPLDPVYGIAGLNGDVFVIGTSGAFGPKPASEPAPHAELNQEALDGIIQRPGTPGSATPGAPTGPSGFGAFDLYRYVPAGDSWVHVTSHASAGDLNSATCIVGDDAGSIYLVEGNSPVVQKYNVAADEWFPVHDVLFHRIWDRTGIGFEESSVCFSTPIRLA